MTEGLYVTANNAGREAARKLYGDGDGVAWEHLAGPAWDEAQRVYGFPDTDRAAFTRGFEREWAWLEGLQGPRSYDAHAARPDIDLTWLRHHKPEDS